MRPAMNAGWTTSCDSWAEFETKNWQSFSAGPRVQSPANAKRLVFEFLLPKGYGGRNGKLKCLASDQTRWWPGCSGEAGTPFN